MAINNTAENLKVAALLWSAVDSMSVRTASMYAYYDGKTVLIADSDDRSPMQGEYAGVWFDGKDVIHTCTRLLEAWRAR